MSTPSHRSRLRILVAEFLHNRGVAFSGRGRLPEQWVDRMIVDQKIQEVSMVDRSLPTPSLPADRPHLIGRMVRACGKGGRGRPRVHIDVKEVRRLQEELGLSLSEIRKVLVVWNGQRFVQPSLGTLVRRIQEHESEGCSGEIEATERSGHPGCPSGGLV